MALELIPEDDNTGSSKSVVVTSTNKQGAIKQAPVRRKVTSYPRTVVAVVMLILVAAVYGLTRPVVVDFTHTVQIYFTPQLQKKAWNEAKRQYFEQDIKANQHQVEQLEKQSFNKVIPVAYAAEIAEVHTVESKTGGQEHAIPTPTLANSVTTIEGVKKPTAETLRAYLTKKGSPLAEYAEVILEQEHWVKILSIANAESSLCKRVDPVHWTNCWGIMKPAGGLRSMGANLGAAVKTANEFIDTNPRGKKYGDRTIEEMNGTWNQPGTKTWVANNYAIINDLKGL